MPTLMSEITQPRLTRDHRPGGEREHAGDERRKQKNAFVGGRRDCRFLQDEFQQVREGLQQAPWSDHVRAAPDLHRRPDLAVGEQHIGDRDQQDHEQQHGLRHDHDQRPEIRSPESASQRIGHSRRRPDRTRQPRRCREIRARGGARQSVLRVARGDSTSPTDRARSAIMAECSKLARGERVLAAE